jgi:hypothetical protein
MTFETYLTTFPGIPNLPGLDAHTQREPIAGTYYNVCYFDHDDTLDATPADDRYFVCRYGESLCMRRIISDPFSYYLVVSPGSSYGNSNDQ